jgi:myo-inositol-1(or 4)-monophosphatase
MTKLKDIAIKAARAAGELILARLGDVGKIEYKGAFNLVTEVDKAAEKIIIEILRKEFPDDAILAEESGVTDGTGSKRRWLIDPIDGTTNFAHSYPFFCVSIAVEEDGQLILGVVFNPVANELFWAQKGGGAWLNDKPIKVSKINKLEESLLSTGFHSSSKASEHANRETFMRMTDSTHGVRRDGSAALDICFVACGRTEGFWERQIALWDIGAGTIIVEEAGGYVTDLSGRNFDLKNVRVNILASNKLVHHQIVEVLNETQLAKN